MRGQIARQEPAAREREAQALELRKAGATFEAIGRQIGMAPSAARRAYLRALERLPGLEHREELRTLEAARLDTLMVGSWARAVKGDEKALSSVLRLMERRAKLLGLDAPAEVNVAVLLKVIGELRSLPQGDLLQALGFEEPDALPELPEHEE